MSLRTSGSNLTCSSTGSPKSRPCWAAPDRTTQAAIADFMADGHYLRHLRRMKALYHARRDLVRQHLASFDIEPLIGVLAMLLPLPGLDDAALAARAWDMGTAPAPLSAWYMGSPARSGLVLRVTNMHEGNIEGAGVALRTRGSAEREAPRRAAVFLRHVIRS